MLKAKKRMQGPFVFLQMEGTLSAKNVTTLKRVMENELTKGNTWIALELSGISKANSLCMGMMDLFCEKLVTSGGKLVIVNPSPEIQHLLQNTKRNNRLPVVKNEEDLALVNRF